MDEVFEHPGFPTIKTGNLFIKQTNVVNTFYLIA